MRRESQPLCPSVQISCMKASPPNAPRVKRFCPILSSLAHRQLAWQRLLRPLDHPTAFSSAEDTIRTMDVGTTGCYITPKYAHVRLRIFHVSYNVNVRPVLRPWRSTACRQAVSYVHVLGRSRPRAVTLPYTDPYGAV